MKYKIYEHEQNYCATVVEINNLEKVIGLDNLVQSSIFGSTVLVGANTAVGDVGVFFPSETVLSQEFLSKNNLYRHTELNDDKDKKAGFFEDNGRCKAIRFKGVVSTGFWIPIESLSYLGGTFAVGDIFQDVDGRTICRKFSRKVKQSNVQTVKQVKLVDLVDERCSPEHYDTDNLFRNLHKFELEDFVSVTVKEHGTSLRCSRNVVYFPTFADSVLPKISGREKWQKLAYRLKLHTLVGKISETLSSWKLKLNAKQFEFKYIVGSRRVIKSIDFKPLDGKQHFYADTDLWTTAAKVFEGKLHKGENIFAEIVGFLPKGGEIQKGYSYGLPSGTFEVHVYRISRTNEDGISQDLPYSLMAKRCEELGVQPVVLVFEGKLKDFIQKYTVEQVDDRNYQTLLESIVKNNFLDKPSIFNNSIWENIEEGIVLTKYQLGNFYAAKAKSPLFILSETKAIDKGASDIEDEQSA